MQYANTSSLTCTPPAVVSSYYKLVGFLDSSKDRAIFNRPWSRSFLHRYIRLPECRCTQYHGQWNQMIVNEVCFHIHINPKPLSYDSAWIIPTYDFISSNGFALITNIKMANSMFDSASLDTTVHPYRHKYHVFNQGFLKVSA